MQPLRGAAGHVLIVLPLLMLGTVNLFKSPQLTQLLHVDPTLAAAGCCALLTAGGLLRERLRWKRSWTPALYCVFLFLPALFVTSRANPYSVEKTTALFVFTPLLLLAPMVLLRSSARRAWFVGAAAGLGASVSVWLLATGQAGEAAGRLAVGDANPIGLGRTACIGVVVMAVLALRSRGAARPICMASTLLCLVAAVATGSRGPVASAMLAVVVVATLTGVRRARLGVVVALAAVAIAAFDAVQRLAPAASIDRLTSAQGGETDQQRVRMAKDALAMVWNHWEGVGWGDFGDFLSMSAVVSAQGARQYPHNVVLETAAEGGVLAVIGLLLVFVVSWRRLLRAGWTTSGQALLAMWILAVGSAMTSSDLIGNRLMWLMVGVGLALPAHAASPGPELTPAADLPPEARDLRCRAMTYTT